MGQHYRIANIDRREAFDAFDYGDHSKLLEFIMNGDGVMAALAAHLVMNATTTGPWAGNRIVVAGDFADEGRFVPRELARYALWEVIAGSFLDSQEAEDVELVQTLPPRLRKPFAFVTAEVATRLIEGMGVHVKFGKRRRLAHALLVEQSFVAEQPEDLFEALGFLPNEELSRAFQILQYYLPQTSSHVPEIVGSTIEGVSVELDQDGQRAKSLTLTRVASKTSSGAIDCSRSDTLLFPADQAAIFQFLGLGADKPLFEESDRRLSLPGQ